CCTGRSRVANPAAGDIHSGLTGCAFRGIRRLLGGHHRRIRVLIRLGRAARILQGVSRKLCVTGPGPTAAKGKPMNRLLVGLAASALVSGGLAVAGLGLASTAQACNGAWGPCGYGPNHWCPGDSLYMDRGGPYQGVEWDMNVCHTWYRVAEGAGNVPEGPNNA